MKQIQMIESIIIELTDQVKEGDQDPFLIGREFDKLTNQLKDAREVIQAEAKEECKKYSQQELEGLGIENKSGGATYNYKNIPEWNLVNEHKKQIEAKAKEFCTGITNQANKPVKTFEKIEEVDEDTGEVFTKYRNIETEEVYIPAIKKSSKGYVIYKNYKKNIKDNNDILSI